MMFPISTLLCALLFMTSSTSNSNVKSSFFVSAHDHYDYYYYYDDYYYDHLWQLARLDGHFNTLVQAVRAARPSVRNALRGNGPLTLFAPSDHAFHNLPPGVLEFLLRPANKDLLTDLLLYHVVNGQVTYTDLVNGPWEQRVRTVFGEKVDVSIVYGHYYYYDVLLDNDVMITTPDFYAKNGILHEIDEVLIPSSLNIPTSDIVHTAMDNGFTQLSTALQAANLLDALVLPNGPFTVFAPTDDAFARLPSVPTDTNQLQNILLYHVASGEVLSKDLSNGQQIRTLQGGTVRISISNGIVRINNRAMVIRADIRTLNGIIHVIDNVLLP